jgi:aminoglycoside phosphotransferase (APT) family kinase protein
VGPAPRPEAEHQIDEALVRALLAEQHPDLLGPLRRVAGGWDNEVFRLGDDLAVRLPRRAPGAGLIESEVRWLPLLAPVLTLEAPVPVRTGEPGSGYPWCWAIVRWVEGETALSALATVDGPGAVAALADFLEALHRPAPDAAPRNPYRGVPLAHRDDRFGEHLAALPPDVDREPVAVAWAEALARPRWGGPALWVHGDLHPGNLVVRERRLVGVLDFGDLTAGDPATDLAVAWMVLGPDDRAALRRRLGSDDATWGRARGWALAHAGAVLAHSADDPAMAAMARRTLAAVLADSPS